MKETNQDCFSFKEYGQPLLPSVPGVFMFRSDGCNTNIQETKNGYEACNYFGHFDTARVCGLVMCSWYLSGPSQSVWF